MENINIASPLSEEQYRTYFENGISYATYVANMTAEVESKVETQYSQYVPLNLHRVKRINKTFKLQSEVAAALERLDKKLNWLIISEHWCGDASQTVPIMAGIAAASSEKINLRVIYRDENPNLMNAHLTNGGKSIAKLIQLSEEFEFMGDWGPRPVEAQKMVLQAKEQGLTSAVYAENLHKWYADDKGISTQMEILALLQK